MLVFIQSFFLFRTKLQQCQVQTLSIFDRPMSALTNHVLIFALESTELEHTEPLLFFGNQKGRARRTLKRLYENSTKEVHLLLVIFRMCRRTSAKIELQNRASHFKGPYLNLLFSTMTTTYLLDRCKIHLMKTF